MSWGERSCAVRSCIHNPTMSTCNVRCSYFMWDGSTQPDSGKYGRTEDFAKLKPLSVVEKRKMVEGERGTGLAYPEVGTDPTDKVG